MPSGTKMRERMKASHDMPETRSMIVPFIAYITFW